MKSIYWKHKNKEKNFNYNKGKVKINFENIKLHRVSDHNNPSTFIHFSANSLDALPKIQFSFFEMCIHCTYYKHSIHSKYFLQHNVSHKNLHYLENCKKYVSARFMNKTAADVFFSYFRTLNCFQFHLQIGRCQFKANDRLYWKTQKKRNGEFNWIHVCCLGNEYFYLEFLQHTHNKRDKVTLTTKCQWNKSIDFPYRILHASFESIFPQF